VCPGEIVQLDWPGLVVAAAEMDGHAVLALWTIAVAGELLASSGAGE
jgi:hypothetical protein